MNRETQRERHRCGEAVRLRWRQADVNKGVETEAAGAQAQGTSTKEAARNRTDTVVPKGHSAPYFWI